MFNNMNMKQMMSLANDPDAIQDIIKESGAAEIVADIINIQRLEHARIAREVGVDADLPRMDEDRAAELIAGLVTDGDVELIEVFNGLEEVGDDVLLELTDEDTVEEWQESKKQMISSGDAAE